MANSVDIEVLLHGLGAIGSFYAFILQKNANVRLSVTARSNYDAVKSKGLLMKSENHGEHLFHPSAVLRNPAEAGHPFDFIVCANKATDLDFTADQLAPVVDEERTTIVLMQNGVGIEDPFRQRFPKCTILSGVVWVGGIQESPGVIRQHLAEGTEIGLFPNPNTPSTKQRQSLDLFTSLLTGGGTPVDVRDSIQTSRWKKVIWNAAWNSLNSLTQVPTHTWLESSSFAMETTRRLMHEAIKVAKANGIPDVEESLVEELITKMQGLKPPVWTSMYGDVKAGRAMEVEVILGTIVKKGKEKGVAVPTLETVYSLLLAIDQRMAKEREQK
jgi:2-dehydropantoate 2-reductase